MSNPLMSPALVEFTANTRDAPGPSPLFMTTFDFAAVFHIETRAGLPPWPAPTNGTRPAVENSAASTSPRASASFFVSVCPRPPASGCWSFFLKPREIEHFADYPGAAEDITRLTEDEHLSLPHTTRGPQDSRLGRPWPVPFGMLPRTTLKTRTCS